MIKIQKSKHIRINNAGFPITSNVAACPVTSFESLSNSMIHSDRHMPEPNTAIECFQMENICSRWNTLSESATDRISPDLNAVCFKSGASFDISMMRSKPLLPVETMDKANNVFVYDTLTQLTTLPSQCHDAIEVLIRYDSSEHDESGSTSVGVAIVISSDNSNPGSNTSDRDHITFSQRDLIVEVFYGTAPAKSPSPIAVAATASTGQRNLTLNLSGHSYP